MTSTGRREQGLDHVPSDFVIEFDVHDRVLKTARRTGHAHLPDPARGGKGIHL